MKVKDGIRGGSCSSDQDLVNGDMYELDKVPDETHDGESYGDGSAELNVFLLRRLGTSVDELSSLLDELLGHVGKVFDHVFGHSEECKS